MMNLFLLLLPVLVPIAGGLLVRFVPSLDCDKERKITVTVVLSLTLVLIIADCFLKDVREELLWITEDLVLLFKLDGMSRIFTVLVGVMWLFSGIYSFEYMKHEENHRRYYTFFLISEGVLVALGYAGNYLTMYLTFELMTILTMVLVLHEGTDESIAAAKKYLYYSIFGASLGLLGFFFLSFYGTTTEFTAGGGILDAALISGHEGMLLVVIFLVIVGFGAKAGMFPLHSWLPAAHPVAPAPASAVLSGVITKAGVLAIIRVVYYLVGTDFLRGTWVQYAWAGLALLTVFMGSMLAYREDVLKKRLAYSSISQVSYILFGLSLMNETAMIGSLLHMCFHSVIKDALFLSAGSIIYKTGKTKVSELRGIGKEMPVVMWCFTIVSLALIGIPPLCGFVSKWYLATGSLSSGLSVISWLGPVILLISALLTAGYLFSITIHGFFPGKDYDYKALTKKEPSAYMTVPLILLAAAAVFFGLFPNVLMPVIESVVTVVF